jgi:hypothetical protein
MICRLLDQLAVGWGGEEEMGSGRAVGGGKKRGCISAEFRARR